ncbi:DoxX family protein [Salinisphaera sp.]|uniref:DoxX family protein n=1 Tax=Salinisphaera sp. TaxID=1914330 RepID=UPI002D78FD52|nr:DoxX family protein [Salinisphaera sp.]HET7314225.1 DoxX family protein [Salinisphaera sp.]
MHFIDNKALGQLVLRLAVGGLVLFHGVSKVAHPGALEFIQRQLTGANLPEMLSYGVYVGEVIGPLLILLGVFSRVGGLLVAINMLFALYLVHLGQIFALSDQGGWAIELQVSYLLGGVAILFLGSGRLAMRPD